MTRDCGAAITAGARLPGSAAKDFREMAVDIVSPAQPRHFRTRVTCWVEVGAVTAVVGCGRLIRCVAGGPWGSIVGADDSTDDDHERALVTEVERSHYEEAR